MSNVQDHSQQDSKTALVNKFLSDVVVFSKYAGIVKGENRKQSWEECVKKYEDMLIKDHPQLEEEIKKNFAYVYDKKVFPSMRSMQYGGDPISYNPTRIYNCSFVTVDDIKVFSEFIWILLSGAGIGVSVQKRHINQLPEIQQPQKEKRFLISDSIEGWADAIRMLMYAYFRGNPYPKFDFRDIRPEGSLIKKLNCIAPGPKRLISSIREVDQILKNAVGRKLTAIEILDILCHISECVVSGGIRSSAVIVLFDKDENSILYGKKETELKSAELVEETEDAWMIKVTPKDIETLHGVESKIVKVQKSFGDYDKNRILNDKMCQWYYLHPQRSMSNNSVVLHRDTTTYGEFMKIMKLADENKSGEPGIFWTNDYDIGTNPCLAGDSLILTKEGYGKILDLYTENGCHKFIKTNKFEDYPSMNIMNSHGFVKATVPYMTSMMNHVYRVTMSNGMEQKVTVNHNFIVLDDKGKKTRKKLSELRMTDRIPLPNYSAIKKRTGDDLFRQFENVDNKRMMCNLATLSGLIIANGGYSLNENGLIDFTVKIFNNQSEIEKINSIISNLADNSLIKVTTSESKGNLYIVNGQFDMDGEDIEICPFDKKNIEYYLLPMMDRKMCADFLSAYIGSCGNISINRDKASIKCWDNDKKFLQQVQMLLQSFDIYSNIVMHNPKKKENDFTKMIGNNVVNHIEGYDLIISGHYYVESLIKHVGIFYENKYNKIDSLLKLMNPESVKKQSRQMNFIKPIAIEYIGKEPTYCLTEPLNNELIVNGMLIGNCGEISLRSGQFCNLTTINAYDIDSQEEFNVRARVASFIGTLQATYTDFHYLRPMWKERTEEDALLGVSMTGVASGKIFNLDETEAAKAAVEENERISKLVGIKEAQRVTTIKPEGTTTLVAGVFGAGVHAAYNEYFVRNIRIRKSDPLYQYISVILEDFVEQDYMDEDKVVLSIPMKADKDCIFRHEPTINLLERIKRLNQRWIRAGHKGGANMNNVSATVSVREGEIDEIAEWMWENRDFYNGITILPYFGGTYKQAPYMDITEEQYYEMLEKFPEEIDLSNVFVPDFTDLKRESACSANGCDVTSL